MESWITEPLSEICFMTSGGTPSRKKAKYYSNGTIPWVKSGELENNTILESEECITEEALNNSSTKIFPKGTLLIALYGATIGKLAFLGIDAATNQAVCGIFENDKVDLKYLYYYLLFSRPNLIKQGQGGAQPNISQTILKKLLVPYPKDRREQQRIVARIEELFSQLDDAEATLEKAKTQLAVYRQAVLRNAFQRTKDSREVMVAEIGDVNLGRQRSPKNVSKDYPTKYIRAANITESGIDISDVLEMEFTPSEREKYYLQNGDIVLSEASGSVSQVGKPAIWRCQIPDCCFQNTVIRHRVVSELPDYIYWYYKYLYETGYFATVVGGVGINHLGANNFAGIKLFLAPREQQLGIVEQLESQLSVYEDICFAIKTVEYQTKALKQSILKMAFGGKHEIKI